MATSQAYFEWTDDKYINIFTRIQKLSVKFSFLNIDSLQWLQGFE